MSENSLSIHERYIKLSILLLFGIPSIICAVYVIYSFIKIPSYRRRFQNQTLIILVFIILFDLISHIPTTISFFIRGYFWPQSEVFCHIWQSIEYSFTTCVIWCTAIFTVERHIFIFHPNYLRSQRQRLFFHFIPLILINLYIILFYILTVFLYECGDRIDFGKVLCGHQCLDTDGSISMFNWLFNILTPVFIVIFGSLFLLIRILWKRRTMQRNLRNWSKNWKMSIQLLGIASIYTVVWLPLAIISFILISNENNRFVKSAEEYLQFVTYACEFSVPIVALIFSSELMQNLCRRRRPNPTSIPSVSIRQHSTNYPEN